MVFRENRLLADDSHEISFLISFENEEGVTRFVVCCSRDWRIKVKIIFFSIVLFRETTITIVIRIK